MEANVLNEEHLNKFTVAKLREILVSFGGTPSNKPKNELISEILLASNGESIPQRKKRGRPNLTGLTYTPDELMLLTLKSPVKINVTNANPPSFSEVYAKSVNANGVLEILNEGYGFLRGQNYSTNAYADIHVSKEVIESNYLKAGDYVTGVAVRGDGLPTLKVVELINGLKPLTEERVDFDILAADYSNEKFNLNYANDISLKLVDLLSPIGKGQRVLIYGEENSGKTTLIKKISKAIENNYSNAKTINLLVNRRPEEVSSFKTELSGEVIDVTAYDNFEKAIKVVNLVVNRVKRLVENGNDVVLVLDDLTALSKIESCQDYSNGGKVLSEISANVFKLKKLLNLARNIKEKGSLTIIATVDVTGEKDSYIVNELKSIVNAEIELSLSTAKHGVYPAIVPSNTFTRNSSALINDKDKILVKKLREIDDIREIINELM